MYVVQNAALNALRAIWQRSSPLGLFGGLIDVNTGKQYYFFLSSPFSLSSPPPLLSSLSIFLFLVPLPLPPPFLFLLPLSLPYIFLILLSVISDAFILSHRTVAQCTKWNWRWR